MIRSIVHAASQLGSTTRDLYVYFQILRDLLGADRVVLLRFLQPDNCFVPYLSSGLSSTTLANLRVPKDLLKEVEKSMFTVFATLPEFLRESFSLGDSNIEQSVLVCPIARDNEFLGMFVWLDNPYASIPRAHMELLFSPIRDMMWRFLSPGFGDEILGYNHAVVATRGLADNGETKSRIQAFENGSVVLVECSAIVDIVTRSYQFLSKEAAVKDLSINIHTACSDFELLHVRDENRSYLLFKDAGSIPVSVIANMLAVRVAFSFFGNDDYLAPISAAIIESTFKEFSSSVLSVLTV